MHTLHAQLPKTLRAITLSLVSLAACGAIMAAEPVLIAKADTAVTSPLALATVASTEAAPAVYPSLAEAELIGMGYMSFDAVLAEALYTATAAGSAPMSERGAIEAVVARLVAGLMP